MKNRFRRLIRGLPALIMVLCIPTMVIAGLICKGAAIVTVVGAILALAGFSSWTTFTVGAITTAAAFITAVGAFFTMALLNETV